MKNMIISLSIVSIVLSACGAGNSPIPIAADTQYPVSNPTFLGYSENVPIRREFITLFKPLNLPTQVTIKGIISVYSYPIQLQFVHDGIVRREVVITDAYQYTELAGPGPFEILARSLNPTSYIKPCETYLQVIYPKEEGKD